MKKVLLFLCILLLSAQAYSKEKQTGTDVKVIGKCGIISPKSVNVVLNSNHSLTTTFNRNISSATITVKSRSGAIISQQTVDAREYDTVTIKVVNSKQDYKPGEYIIEITCPEGILEGKF